jgi:MFS family permease
VQSIGGALILANGSAIITDAFPKNELGKALGINGMIISVGAAIAPLVGGFITLRFGWRWVFFFNVPLGLLGTIWAAIAIHETAILPKGQHFDLEGALLFGMGMFLLLLALSLGGFNGWGSRLILWLFICAALLISLFVFVEMHVAEPLFDIELFKSKTLSFAFLATLLNGVARGALIFLLIFYLQGVRAMDPLLAGLYIMPFSIGLMVISPISGSLADRYGSQILSTLGLSLSAIGLLGYTWIRADTPLSQVILWQTVVGIGSGFFNSPNSNTIMGAVRPERRGIAAGTRTMMLNAGSVISLAMTFAVISSGLTQEAMQGLFAGTQVGSEGIAIDQFIHDLHIAFFISFCISIVAAIISFVRGPEPKNNT